MKKSDKAASIIDDTLIRDASDTLLFLADSFEDKKKELSTMELLKYVEDVSQDIVYNLTCVVRSITNDVNDEPEDLLG